MWLFVQSWSPDFSKWQLFFVLLKLPRSKCLCKEKKAYLNALLFIKIKFCILKVLTHMINVLSY